MASNKSSQAWRIVCTSHTSHLAISTLLFGSITFLLFWGIVKWNLLPVELSTEYLTQENTGLFDALGGWALGFAGALVAIRIAGLAANIQQNDSIREHVALLASQVERISDLNSRLTRAVFDAKRASAAVLLHAEDLYTKQLLPSRMPEYLRNSISMVNETAESKDAATKQRKSLEEGLQCNLEKKVETLIEVIEEAFRDSVFRAAILSANKNNNQVETGNSAYLISEFFNSQQAQDSVVNIIKHDEHFYNVIEGLNHSERNFGIGLIELRAKNLFEHFATDLSRITQFQKRRADLNGNNIEISDAAWLFLGLLLLRSKDDNDSSNNHGFIFIALLLGSLPTRETIKQQMHKKIADAGQSYSKTGVENLYSEVDALFDQLYYIKGEELSDLAKLVSLCSDNLDYLAVTAKNTGVSNFAKDSDLRKESSNAEFEPQDKKSTPKQG